MPKTSTADVEYLKLPKDFSSLHNLKDLVKYHQATLDAAKSLEQYKQNYSKYTDTLFDSFRMNCDEILQQIEHNLDKYQVCLQGRCVQNYAEHINGEKISRKYTIFEALRIISKDEKVFLLDTINKKIEICYWLFPDDYYSNWDSDEYAKEYSRLRMLGAHPDEIPEPTSRRNFRQRRGNDTVDVLKSHIPTKQLSISNKNSRYTNYTLSIKGTEILEIRAEFYRSYYRYKSEPGRMANMSCLGYDIHHISINRNLYLGFQTKLSKYGEEHDKVKTIYTKYNERN